MLRADSMPRSENTALEQAKGRFNGIGMNIAVHVQTLAMRDGFVFVNAHALPNSPRRTAILSEIVSHKDVHVFADIFTDVLFKGSGAHVFGMKEAQFTLPLTNSDYDFFVGRSASSLSVSLAAHVGLVHFNHTAEPLAVSLNHRGADPVTEVPSRLVGHSERALNLTGRHALFRFAEQECGEKPLPKGEMRIVEYRSSGNAKLIVAVVAVVLKPIGDWSGLRQAARALRAVRPAKLFQNLTAFLVAAKLFAQFGYVDVFRQ